MSSGSGWTRYNQTDARRRWPPDSLFAFEGAARVQPNRVCTGFLVDSPFPPDALNGCRSLAEFDTSGLFLLQHAQI
jgi:hypothetical protein